MRGGWPLGEQVPAAAIHVNHPIDLPPATALARQAAWLAPLRARLLRRAGVARRRRVLDLGAGFGAVTGELVRRAGGLVVALDHALAALAADPVAWSGAGRVGADARRLPFRDDWFDLVFCQCVLMWLAGPEGAGLDASVREIARVLAPGGVLVALEPDHGGLIEHPETIATRDLWLAGLVRAGADPRLGRKLPGALERAGLRARVDLVPRLLPPAPARFDLLRDLPLDAVERARLARVEAADRALAASGGWSRVAHLPVMAITAEKPWEDARVRLAVRGGSRLG